MEKIAYGGWENCYRLSNGQVELIVTGDVGPRIIHLSFVGQENEFFVYEEWLGRTGDPEWLNYGGHRLWHAPEVASRTYAPDNSPVTVQEQGDCVRFIQPVEPTTGIQKEIELTLAADAARVKVLHRLRNAGRWAVELAPWALSVMAQRSVIIIPLPPRGPHDLQNLLPTSLLTLWPYTDLTDPRWTWGTKYILLRQDPAAQTPQKIGASVPTGWVACARDGHLFVVQFDFVPGAAYPDLGCNVETFTNGRMLEVETLGPLVRLEPGATVEYVERWSLFQGVPVPTCDADVEAHVLPLVRAASKVS